MPAHPLTEIFEAHRCPVVLRRITGPRVRELFIGVQPPQDTVEVGQQAEAIYRALLDVLEAEGGSFESVVSETVFLRHLQSNIDSLRDARHRVLAPAEVGTPGPATLEIEQAPLNERACMEMSVQAVFPNGSSPEFTSVKAEPRCECDECSRTQGLRIRIGEEGRFHAAGLCGPGATAYQQTLGMFGLAEALLKQAGMEFTDVVRAWIFLRDMERDYGELNRARREFFNARGIDPVPASTGIGGGPVSEKHDLCLSIYAVKSGHPTPRTVMTSPTLNEAAEYGADFVRGMKVTESNKVALHISGTASIDESGRTVHVGDFEAQAERMLLNVAALLERQGAGFGDVVSAVTYLKHPADAPRLREKFRAAGYEGFPNVLVAAQVCRPELLCETEAFAFLPRTPGV